MSVEIIFVFGLLAVAFFLFSTSYVSYDVAALIILALLLASGILTPKEGFPGFSNPATPTVAAMFILSAGLRKTGILNKVGRFFTERIRQNFWLGLFEILLFISPCSAFINITAVVVIFIPVIIHIADQIEISPSKLLMPLSFAASLSFITPFGYQTNTLIYGAGHYKFTDFTKIGLPLNFIFWILATIFIRMIWSF